jgi:hypothetical protein
VDRVELPLRERRGRPLARLGVAGRAFCKAEIGRPFDEVHRQPRRVLDPERFELWWWMEWDGCVDEMDVCQWFTVRQPRVRVCVPLKDWRGSLRLTIDGLVRPVH